MKKHFTEKLENSKRLNKVMQGSANAFNMNVEKVLVNSSDLMLMAERIKYLSNKVSELESSLAGLDSIKSLDYYA